MLRFTSRSASKSILPSFIKSQFRAASSTPSTCSIPFLKDSRGLLLSRVSGPTDKPLSNQSLGECWDSLVNKYSNNQALIVRHEPNNQHSNNLNRKTGVAKDDACIRWSFTDMDDHIQRISKGLIDLGVQRGDVVAVLMMNNSSYAALQWATAKIGAILVTLNPSYTQGELRRALNHTGASVLICVPSLRSSDYISHLTEMLPSLNSSSSDPTMISDEKVPTLKRLVLVDNLSSRPLGWESSSLLASEGLGFQAALSRLSGRAVEYRDLLSSKVKSSELPLMDCHEVVNLQLTSGTTGTPKAVALSSHNLLNNGIAIGDQLGFEESDRLTVPVPLFHCFGLTLSNAASWTHGSSVVYASEGFDPLRTLRATSQEGSTALHGVPSMFVSQLEVLDAVRDHEKDSSKFQLPKGVKEGEKFEFKLRTGLTSGSTVPIELQKRIISVFGAEEQTVVYGMTETSPVSFGVSRSASLEKRCQTVGQIYPHCHAKIVSADDVTGQPLPINTPGELCTSGYIVMKGYWKDEAKTKEVVQTHKDSASGKEMTWMRTGDVASMDEEGYVRIVGREKDVIIRGGENIFPAVVENSIETLEGVGSSAVIAVPDERLGETVGVFISTSSSLTPESVRAHVKSQISAQSAPEYVWILGKDGVAEELPKTASGKVKKNELREWAKELKEKGLGRVKRASEGKRP